MSIDVLKLIDEFNCNRVAVIGEAMLDSYLEGNSNRICREAPVPVVVIKQRVDVPGGAANTAVNIASLGGKVEFLSVIGDDKEGKIITESLEQLGISTEHVIKSSSRATLAKNRVIAGSQMVVRYDQGTTRDLDKRIENQLIRHLKDIFKDVDALIISDYGYGILTAKVIQVIKELQRKKPRVIVADSKFLTRYKGVGITVVKPNYAETLRLLGLNDGEDRVQLMAEHGEKVLKFTGAEIAAITLDEEGALIFEKDQCAYRTYAKPAPDTRAAGAGDTFVSAFTMALVGGAPTPTAAELASAAASVVVSRDGTAACTADDLRIHFTDDEKYIHDAFYLAARVATYRNQGKSIVFTNGCFDILHRGHINYLNKAKSFGDVLIVGMNTDESVRRLKGENRPINSLEDRAQILAALSSVDHIIPFDEDTPVDLIRKIQPNTYVKGGDYTRETLPEADIVEHYGGNVVILPYLQDHSTTGVIERIRKLYADAE